MPFHFSLAALLQFRRSQERQQEILLRQAAQRSEILRREIAAAESALQELVARDARQVRSGMHAAELHFNLLRRSVLSAWKKQLEKDLTAAEIVRDLRSREFQLARQKREAVEALRRHQFQLYQDHERRQEQRDLDDLFLLRRGFLRRG